MKFVFIFGEHRSLYYTHLFRVSFSITGFSPFSDNSIKALNNVCSHIFIHFWIFGWSSNDLSTFAWTNITKLVRPIRITVYTRSCGKYVTCFYSIYRTKYASSFPGFQQIVVGSGSIDSYEQSVPFIFSPGHATLGCCRFRLQLPLSRNERKTMTTTLTSAHSWLW